MSHQNWIHESLSSKSSLETILLQTRLAARSGHSGSGGSSVSGNGHDLGRDVSRRGDALRALGGDAVEALHEAVGVDQEII